MQINFKYQPQQYQAEANDMHELNAEEYGLEPGYMNQIVHLRRLRIDQYFPIHSEKDVKLLADLIIGKGGPTTQVMIYSEKFSMHQYQNALENCRGHIKILVDDDSDFPHQLQTKNQYQFRKLNPTLVGTAPYFFLAGHAFIFETDALSYSAVANFNNRKDAKILNESFNDFWERS